MEGVLSEGSTGDHLKGTKAVPNMQEHVDCLEDGIRKQSVWIVLSSGKRLTLWRGTRVVHSRKLYLLFLLEHIMNKYWERACVGEKGTLHMRSSSCTCKCADHLVGEDYIAKRKRRMDLIQQERSIAWIDVTISKMRIVGLLRQEKPFCGSITFRRDNQRRQLWNEIILFINARIHRRQNFDIPTLQHLYNSSFTISQVINLQNSMSVKINDKDHNKTYYILWERTLLLPTPPKKYSLLLLTSIITSRWIWIINSVI